MAKKQFAPLDDLVNSLDDLNAPSVKPRSAKKTFTELPTAAARDIALATNDKTMAGQYKRKQILIPPAQLDFIRGKAKEIGVSQAELFRWLIDYGLTALGEGISPTVETVEVRGETKKSHWTSQ